MADIYVIVDPDGGDGYDYLSLNLAESGENGDLTGTGYCYIGCRSSEGTPDSTAVTFSGWTVDSTHYPIVYALPGHEALKTTWSTSRYRLHMTDTNYQIRIQCSYIDFIGLQIKNDYGSVTLCNCLYVDAILSGNSLISFRNCRIESNANGTYQGLQVYDADAIVKIENCIFSGFHRYGINIRYGTLYLYNSIIYNTNYVNGAGIYIESNGTVTATNCIIFNTSNDINNFGSLTATNCATDDGDGSNPISPSGSNWTNELPNYATGNFTITNSGNCYHGGIHIDGVIYDIEGDEYDAFVPSVGVDEVISFPSDIPILRRRRAA
ncbi:MAG: right-handed parallel beta-helix repeat-containing protein [Spirochaetes bacterium]|nr:right-handed parallel beta-helix repeat-containing protein [Spirochaetota bacterium]